MIVGTQDFPTLTKTASVENDHPMIFISVDLVDAGMSNASAKEILSAVEEVFGDFDDDVVYDLQKNSSAVVAVEGLEACTALFDEITEDMKRSQNVGLVATLYFRGEMVETASQSALHFRRPVRGSSGY